MGTSNKLCAKGTRQCNESVARTLGLGWEDTAMKVDDTFPQDDHHKAGRGGWLRAAVLGANDGLVSTSSLMVGVAAAGATASGVVTAGVAAIAAGALSMAVGEYVSVSSQADIEAADTALEQANLLENPEGELAELAALLRHRGLSRETAVQAAAEMTAHDALDNHLREELGRHEANEARPLQAALASAGSFLVGGVVPFFALLAPESIRIQMIFVVTFIGLGAAGTFSGIASGMNPVKPTIRVIVGGLLAMAATYGVGFLFHTNIA